MFGELIKLRELSSLLKKGRYAAVLDLARNPAIRGHRKAKEAAEKARDALAERAEKHRKNEDFVMALKDVRRLLRDDEDERARSLERAILADMEAGEQRAQALAREKEKARRDAEAGELTMALDRLETMAQDDAGAASLARDLKERRAAAEVGHRNFALALKQGKLEQAFEVTRTLDLKSGEADWKTEYEALLDAAAAANDVPLLVAIIADGRRRSRGTWAPGGQVCDRVSERILQRVEKDLHEQTESSAGDWLGVFPLGRSGDARAEVLAKALRRLERAERLFSQGDLLLAVEMAQEARSLAGRCQRAKALVARIEKIQSRSKGPLQKARDQVASGSLVQARSQLVALLEEHPNLGEARDLLQVVEKQEKEDLSAIAAARERMQNGELDESRSMLLALSSRRPDLEDLPVLLRDVERRSREHRLRGFAEESLRLESDLNPNRAGLKTPFGQSAPTSDVPALPAELNVGQPFTLRVEERGDWFVHPGDHLVLGNSMAGAADLPVLAAIGSRHARIRREGGRGKRAAYFVDPGPGKRVTKNRRPLGSEVELHHGDEISLADVLTFTFLRPVPGNDTAVLRLEGNFLVHGCSRILLYSETGETGAVVIGPGPEAHVPLGPDRDRVELLREEAGSAGRLLARCPYGVNVEDGEQRPQVQIKPGMRIHTVDVDFFVDPA